MFYLHNISLSPPSTKPWIYQTFEATKKLYVKA